MKPFAWSYSRLKNYETCPKRHWHLDINKDFKEEDSESLRWGDQVHKALAKRVSLGTPLPAGMEPYEKWCEKVLATPGTILVEQKLAIDQQFGPCEFFAPSTWFRSVADVLKILGDVALTVDWKTGKVLEDSVQLALTAATVFAHHPTVQKIRTEFVWLKEDCTTREDFTREQMVVMWRHLWPRIESLRDAYNTTTYPPKPGGLCRRFCPITSCPYHGVGNK